MMEKLAQSGEGGDARPPPFPTFTITYKVAGYALAELADLRSYGADTLTLFHLYPICTLWLKLSQSGGLNLL